MRKSSVYLAITIVLCLAVSIQAGVVIKQKSKVEAGGMVNMDISSTEFIQSDKSYNGGTVTMSGGMMAMMGGMKPTEFGQVTRLDKKVMWQLDYEHKTYTEMSMAAFKHTMGQGGMGQMPGGGDNPEEFDWTVDVTDSDDETDINGFKCKNIIAKATGVNKEDPENKMQLTYEYWYTSDVDGYDELKDHYQNFSDVTGVDLTQSQQSAGQIFSKYGSQFDEMTKKMSETEGFPIKTVIKVESVGGDDKGGMAGMPPEMMAMMGKKDKGEGEMMTVFSLTTETISIEKQDIDDSKFEIPEGFEKK